MDFPLDYEPEIDGPIFREELGPWLPEELFDFHSHIFRLEDRGEARRREPNPSMPYLCDAYPLENYQDSMARLFPGKRLHALLFSTIDPECDLEAQNAYVAEATRGDRLHGLMVSGLMDDDLAIEQAVRAGSFLGLKPYWTYVTHKPQADVTLEDMIPPGQRRVADRMGLILMVHIPRPGRLADPLNVEGMARLCQECPNAKVVMAHFGRSYFPEAVGDLRSLPEHENLLVDFSMVQDWEVCERIIDTFGPDRILFGLDMPVAQEKGKLISANGQRHFFTKRPHSWSIHNPGGSYKMRCTFFAYEIIRAFKKAAQRAGLGPEDVAKVFHGNAAGLVEGVEAGLAAGA